MKVGIDFHGLIIDHRVAKHAFFRDVMGCAYSNPFLDRAQILSEIASRGLGRDFYFEAFMKFIHSDYYTRSELVSGFTSFLATAPKTWDIYVVSTAVYNIVASVTATLFKHQVMGISGVLTLSDKEKADVLANSGISLYFDDKSELLGDIRDRGIVTVQVCSRGYSEVTKVADFYFGSWDEVRENVSAISSACTKGGVTVYGAQDAPADAKKRRG